MALAITSFLGSCLILYVLLLFPIYVAFDVPLTLFYGLISNPLTITSGLSLVVFVLCIRGILYIDNLEHKSQSNYHNKAKCAKNYGLDSKEFEQMQSECDDLYE